MILALWGLCELLEFDLDALEMLATTASRTWFELQETL